LKRKDQRCGGGAKSGKGAVTRNGLVKRTIGTKGKQLKEKMCEYRKAISSASQSVYMRVRKTSIGRKENSED